MQQSPQRETTPFYPRSPYAVAKLYAHWITVNYREAYGIYACNGILFNHESPLRGETIVSRKVKRALARIALGLQDCVHMGNPGALRDWGHARDCVHMQWLMLQHGQPEEFVIATGQQHSVRKLVLRAAAALGMKLMSEGKGVEEVGMVAAVHQRAGDLKVACRPGEVVVRVDPGYFRPSEVETLLGDAGKARDKLGWSPTTSFEQMVDEMVLADDARAKRAKRDSLVRLAGFMTFDQRE